MTGNSNANRSNTLIGYLLTTVIIVIGLAIIIFREDISKRSGLAPNEVGDFLAGLFAPIALIWLIIGYYQQATELRENSKAIRQQAEESSAQTESLKQQLVAFEEQKKVLERNAFVDSYYLRYNELIFRCASILRAFTTTEIWSRNLNWFASGYTDVFANWLKNEIHSRGEDKFLEDYDGFFLDDRQQLNYYTVRFEQFMTEADKVDETGALRQVIETSGLGAAYFSVCMILNKDADLKFRPKKIIEKEFQKDGFR